MTFNLRIHIGNYNLAYGKFINRINNFLIMQLSELQLI